MSERKNNLQMQGKKESLQLLGDKQTMEEKIPQKMNRKYQDSFFCSLFKEPKYRKAVYLLMHPEDADVSDLEFQNIELNNIFTLDIYNDICFMVRDRLIILMEHQSTLNYNMPVRMFLYIAEEYKKLFSMDKYKGVLYGTEQIQIPKPEFYMVYTGKGECPASLRLSDCFEHGDQNSFLDLTITVYKDNNSKGIIKEFIGLITQIKTAVANGFTMEQAVIQALKRYQSGYEISDFFKGREDVFEMLGEALTLEEMLVLRDEANAQVISKRVEKQVTEQVTKQVTKQVTDQVTKQVTDQVTEQMTQENICKSFRILQSAGIHENEAIQIITNEYQIPRQKILTMLKIADC